MLPILLFAVPSFNKCPLPTGCHYSSPNSLCVFVVDDRVVGYLHSMPAAAPITDQREQCLAFSMPKGSCLGSARWLALNVYNCLQQSTSAFPFLLFLFLPQRAHTHTHTHFTATLIRELQFQVLFRLFIFCCLPDALYPNFTEALPI